MLIKTFVNSIFNSNTYLIYKEESEEVWVLDPGSDFDDLIRWIVSNGKKVTGILITHAHFDHIMGLNQLVERFPDSKVYGSLHATEGFHSAKVNGSYYQEMPFVYEQKVYFSVKEGDSIRLWEDEYVKVLETPGHGIDCISFYLNGNLFTGDALIPGVKVYTKFKKSNKEEAIHSIKRLMSQFDTKTMIWPGHETNCLIKDLNIV